MRKTSKPTVILIVMMVAFFVVSDVGVLSSYDGLLFAIVAVLTWRWMAPYLYLALVSVQDLPGLSISVWYYSSIVFLPILAVVFIRQNDHTLRNNYPISKEGRSLVYLGIAVITYGLFIAFLNDSIDRYAQSDSRPYLLTSIATGFMIANGSLVALLVRRQRKAYERLYLAAGITIIHMLLIGILQIPLGPDAFASETGRADYFEVGSALYMNIRSSFIPRLTSTTVNPNTFGALLMMFSIILIIANVNRTKPNKFIPSFVILSNLTVAALTQTRTILLFVAILSVVVVVLSSRGGFERAIIVSFLLFTIASIFYILKIDLLLSSEIGAISSGGSVLGARGAVIWQAPFNEFDGFAWILGVGRGHWPELYAGFRAGGLPDPHNWILSALGNFGIFGLVFYGFLIFSLAKFSWRNLRSKPQLSIAGWILLFVVIVRDFFDIPTPLHNTPTTAMFWAALLLFFNSNKDVSRKNP